MISLSELSKVATEARNEKTLKIDHCSSQEIVEAINREDKQVADAVEKALSKISQGVDSIVEAFQNGGRLIYIGAGTSGRLGVLDASECPPTYGVSANLVQGVIAGGKEAIFRAIEGAEDSELGGKLDLEAISLTSKDVVCGIAASGRTPYVMGALKYATKLGCKTIAISMNSTGTILQEAAIPIAVEVGPEVVMGSTRMKAGTAQKMILNMLTTASMIRYGKVYSNLMVDVQPTNEKLKMRAVRIVMLATGAIQEEAEKILSQAQGEVKKAIVMILSGVALDQATHFLKESQGRVAQALQLIKEKTK